MEIVGVVKNWPRLLSKSKLAAAACLIDYRGRPLALLNDCLTCLWLIVAYWFISKDMMSRLKFKMVVWLINNCEELHSLVPTWLCGRKRSSESKGRYRWIGHKSNEHIALRWIVSSRWQWTRARQGHDERTFRSVAVVDVDDITTWFSVEVIEDQIHNLTVSTIQAHISVPFSITAYNVPFLSVRNASTISHSSFACLLHTIRTFRLLKQTSCRSLLETLVRFITALLIVHSDTLQMADVD